MNEQPKPLNLALLPIEEQQRINADLIACRLRHEMSAKTMKISDWQAFVRTDLEKLTPELADQVRQALKKRASR
ncbi:hypothetical protein [Azomonas agilis]|uniref:hypothetical protein n=1 Tax=Azomonas agilis TaxID=116849 RepID=UPI0011A09194|nr:hypothetical protein [Azomonas agilis]